MSEYFEVYDAKNNHISSFHGLIECGDFSDIGGFYLYAFVGFPLDKTTYFDSDTHYLLKTKRYDGRLDFEFSVIGINIINQVAYFRILKRNGMYTFGALTLLSVYEKADRRVFIEIKKQCKFAYLSASYLVSGFKKNLNKNEIILDGKYIIDTDSFFCELGYGFFGTFGYMGWNLNAVADMLNDMYQIDNPIKIKWVNFEQSKLMIANSRSDLSNFPDYDFIEWAKDVLQKYCDLSCVP
ncbi:barstar family protein [Thorsellia anophelis]|uniref:Barstar (Barnase inhibitor) n=1 Tax=Thorsellia anophelis DSM 18579 TaxID=1123402 RepID=A0A1H9Y3B1_9GAMM|nr:barstar family protein [Thorsellia anophelis]SES62829.1 Barstar (barnase inhibitor) [Thorsellia anophelis DSM 18579]